MKHDKRSLAPALLEVLPCTCGEMAQLAGTSEDTAYKWMKRLRGSEVYIFGWKRSGQNWTPVWARGTLPDFPRPKPMTKAQTSRRYRRKQRESGEYFFERARRRASWHADQKAKGKPQGPFAALGV